MLEQALTEISSARDPAALQDVRVKYLGKKGAVTQQLKGLGKLAPDERRTAGQAINKLKSALEDAVQTRRAELERDRPGRTAQERKRRRDPPRLRLLGGRIAPAHASHQPFNRRVPLDGLRRGCRS